MSALMLVAVFALTAPPPAADTVEAPSRWYGWEILAADLAGVGIAFASSGADGKTADVLVTAGALTLALGSPTIHLAHGEGWHALQAYGVRGLGVVTGVLVASAVVARS